MNDCFVNFVFLHSQKYLFLHTDGCCLTKRVSLIGRYTEIVEDHNYEYGRELIMNRKLRLGWRWEFFNRSDLFALAYPVVLYWWQSSILTTLVSFRFFKKKFGIWVLFVDVKKTVGKFQLAYILTMNIYHCHFEGMWTRALSNERAHAVLCFVNKRRGWRISQFSAHKKTIVLSAPLCIP